MDLQSQSPINEAEILRGLPEDTRECVINCTRCHQVCEQTLAHCLANGGPHADPVHIRSLRDCLQSCALSADMMLRHSPLHHRMCGVCSEACATCADSCEKMAEGDELMSLCTQMCRTCAASCQRMAAMVVS